MLAGRSVLRARPFPARTEMAVAVVVRGGAACAFHGACPRSGSGGHRLLARLRRLPPRTASPPTLHLRTPPIGDEGNAPAIPSSAPPDRVIVLNCFGRGGSGIVWRMHRRLPDVIMTSREWHVARLWGEEGSPEGSSAGVSVLGIRVGQACSNITPRKDTRHAEAERMRPRRRRAEPCRQGYGLPHCLRGYDRRLVPTCNVHQPRATPVRPMRESDAKRLDPRTRLPLVL